MEAVNTVVDVQSSFMNLKEIELEKVRDDVMNIIAPGEDIIQAFKTVRDQVVFTDKRVITVNVQNLVGKRVSYFSYPYSKIQYYGIETAGVLDIDSELILAFSDGIKLTFDFRSRVDIKAISANIQKYTM